jgi:N-acetylglucosamine-6-sulfatase
MKAMSLDKGIKIGGGIFLILILIALTLTLFKQGTVLPTQKNQISSKDHPNILFILTDDQDLASLQYMPKLQKYLVQEGTSFSNYFDNYSLCCVARASILRGQYANNTGIKSNGPPDGGFEKFYAQGEEKETVGVWLQNAGYETAFIGKYLNGYGKDDGKKKKVVSNDTKPENTYIPPGWDEWDVSFTQEVYDYQMNENGKIVSYGSKPEDFKTDVLANKAVSFLEHRQDTDSPFFMYLAPLAPHAPATPAPRHKDMFRDLQVPRTPSFNEADVSDKSLWVREQPLLSEKKMAELDEKYRDRLGSLQAEDDMIERVIQTLEKTGELDNTYIVYTTDNGFHLGQHRLDAGKQTIYEEDIHLPLIVRGPGISKGRVVDNIIGNTDLAPTFAELAGRVPIPITTDGRSFAGLLSDHFPIPHNWRNGYLIGFTVDDLTTMKKGKSKQAVTEDMDNDSGNEDGNFLLGPNIGKKGYMGVRTKNYMYAEFLNGDKELYDLQKDPMELNNIAKTADQTLLSSLQAMLEKLRNCSGDACRRAEEMSIPEE